MRDDRRIAETEPPSAAAAAAAARPCLSDAPGAESTAPDTPLPTPFATFLPCVHCGYDLRLLAVTGRCPECGQPILATYPARDSSPWSRRVDIATALAANVTIVVWAALGTLLFCSYHGSAGICIACFVVVACLALILIAAGLVIVMAAAATKCGRAQVSRRSFICGFCAILLSIVTVGMFVWAFAPRPIHVDGVSAICDMAQLAVTSYRRDHRGAGPPDFILVEPYVRSVFGDPDLVFEVTLQPSATRGDRFC